MAIGCNREYARVMVVRMDDRHTYSCTNERNHACARTFKHVGLTPSRLHAFMHSAR